MPITEAARRATLEYVKKHYDQMCIKVKKGTREKIRERATERNQSLNEYVSSLIYEDMDGIKTNQADPEIRAYLKFVRKLFRREKLWADLGNTLARCLADNEITEDDYRDIVFASGVDRNKFDAKMKKAGINLPDTHHIIR